MSDEVNPSQREVQIEIGEGHVGGTLGIPRDPQGLVIFAHGSGSSRFSPRNHLVAGHLQKSHFATLLMDLLTPAEEAIDDRTAELRFNIPFLGNRLSLVTDWVMSQPNVGALPRAYFGASTGAAAALVAAAQRGDIAAVVSRGGRPDLAGDALERVHAPVLLLVGGKDEAVIKLNEEAQRHLGGRSKLEIIPGASHLFEEHGTLELVAAHAGAWFQEHLADIRKRRIA